MSLKKVDFPDGFTSTATPSVVSVVSIKTDRIEVNNTHKVTGNIVLSSTPTIPNSIAISWNGIDQYLDQDFSLSGNVIDLNGFLLLDLINVGETLEIKYQ